MCLETAAPQVLELSRGRGKEDAGQDHRPHKGERREEGRKNGYHTQGRAQVALSAITSTENVIMCKIWT